MRMTLNRADTDPVQTTNPTCTDPQIHWALLKQLTLFSSFLNFQIFKLFQLLWTDINPDSELSLETGETYPLLQFPVEYCDGTWTGKRFELKLLQTFCEASIPEDLQSLKHFFITEQNNKPNIKISK